MKKFLLIVDNREPKKLKDEIKKKIDNCVFQNLKAGDFKFVDCQTKKTVLLIERKEIADLCSSLTDGRFNDQKQKLANESKIDNCDLAFIIEGNYQHHQKQKSIETIVLTTRFRDSFFLLKTAGLHQTVKVLVKLLSLFERGKMKKLSHSEIHQRHVISKSSQRGGAKFTKKDNWWLVSLGQVPGIGFKTAQAIIKMYPTIKTLIDAYAVCKTIKTKEELLQNVKSSDAQRKIGPKASKAVYQCIFANGHTTLFKDKQSQHTTTPFKDKQSQYKTTPFKEKQSKQSSKTYSLRKVQPILECLFSEMPKSKSKLKPKSKSKTKTKVQLEKKQICLF